MNLASRDIIIFESYRWGSTYGKGMDNKQTTRPHQRERRPTKHRNKSSTSTRPKHQMPTSMQYTGNGNMQTCKHAKRADCTDTNWQQWPIQLTDEPEGLQTR